MIWRRRLSCWRTARARRWPEFRSQAHPVGALQALVLSAQGDEAAALAALQEAVERAAPGGALRLLVDADRV